MDNSNQVTAAETFANDEIRRLGLVDSRAVVNQGQDNLRQVVRVMHKGKAKHFDLEPSLADGLSEQNRRLITEQLEAML